MMQDRLKNAEAPDASLSPHNVVVPVQRRHAKGTGMLVLIGPSGSGKSGLVATLSAAGLTRSIPTWTTRKRRSSEAECADHHFVSHDEFAAARLTNRLTFCTQAFDDEWYGLPTPTPFCGKGRVPLVIARAFVYDHCQLPDFGFIVYNLIAGRETLQHRVAMRSGFAEVASRLSDCEAEMALGCELADRTYINDGPFEQLVTQLKADLLGDFFSGHEQNQNA